MKRRLFSICSVVFWLWAGSAAAADLGSGYTYWSSYKPGTTVSFRSATTGSGSDRNIVLTVSVKSVDPDRVVLVFKEAASPEVKGSTAGMESSIEFMASAFAREKEDLFKGMFPVNITGEIAEAEAVIEKAVEDLTVKSTRIRADRVRNIHEILGVRNAVTIWLSDEVPGQLVKLVREIKTGSTTLREEVQATDFTALPASADEIAHLRAARKPVWVEVTAQSLLMYETRFPDDMENLQKSAAAWKKAMSSLVPDAPNNNLNEFYKDLYSYREKISQLKNHWAEDRPAIESEMEISELEKIRPMLKAMSRYAEALGKPLEWLDRIPDMGKKASAYEEALALVEVMKGEESELIAAARSLQAESQKLRNLKLKVLR